MQKLAYTPKEVCFSLAISKAHFYRLVRRRELFIYKEGRATRVAASALQDYVARRAARAAEDQRS